MSTGTLVRADDDLARGMAAVLQPIVDLDSGRVVGVEALARFADHRGPEAHFAEAETSGRRVALELAAVRAGLARLADLPEASYLTLNVSPEAAASPELALALDAAPADRIVLELTEHSPVADYGALEDSLAGLRARGVRIAVDDAGAGFASMRHVLALRPEVLKLDASITRGIHADARRRELVRALVSFARATGCTVVAEGIETSEELDAVRALGVHCGQGFWLGRPGHGAAGPWNVALPKRPRRAFPRRTGTACVEPSAASRAPYRGWGRFGRLARPAGVILVAAVIWPGIVAAAGLKAPETGAQTHISPVAGSRSDTGGSLLTRLPAPRPAAALLPAPAAHPDRALETPAAESPATPDVAPSPRAGMVAGAGDVAGGLIDTVGEGVDGAVSLVGSLLGP